MMTDAVSTSRSLVSSGCQRNAASEGQKVVIVNGSADIVELLETVLQAGHYDIVFVESSDHAYSQIKRVRPNLVIMCVNVEELDGFQVLSMLSLDSDTRQIPILTYTTDDAKREAEEDLAEPSDEGLLAPRPTVRMN